MTVDAVTHVFIPDTQAKPGAPTAHLRWIGQYVTDRWAGKPLKLIHAGDHADMPSLSSYDKKGSKAMENRRYKLDVKAANESFEILNAPMEAYDASHKVKWPLERYITLGNHENRMTRAAEQDAQLDGLITVDDLNYAEHGWTVVPFLEPIVLDGVTYCHYFYNPMSGRPYGGQSMDTRLKTIGFPFTQGHQQGFHYGVRYLNNGTAMHGLIAGSCYLHDEDYAGPQGNNHWRGIIVKHQVERGSYDIMQVSLDYLCRRYEGMSLKAFLHRGRTR